MKLRNKKTGEITSDYSYILLESTHYKEYHSIKKLTEEWEDYTTKEPLIKDENIRKAVKAWAYVNSVKTVTYDELPCDRGLNVFFFEDSEEENVIIQFYGWVPTLNEDETYTIAELCGEEE